MTVFVVLKMMTRLQPSLCSCPGPSLAHHLPPFCSSGIHTYQCVLRGMRSTVGVLLYCSQPYSLEMGISCILELDEKPTIPSNPPVFSTPNHYHHSTKSQVCVIPRLTFYIGAEDLNLDLQICIANILTHWAQHKLLLSGYNLLGAIRTLSNSLQLWFFSNLPYSQIPLFTPCDLTSEFFVFFHIPCFLWSTSILPCHLILPSFDLL